MLMRSSHFVHPSLILKWAGSEKTEFYQLMAQEGQPDLNAKRHRVAVGISQQLFHPIHEGIIIKHPVQRSKWGYRNRIRRTAGQIPGEIVAPACWTSVFSLEQTA